MTEQDAMKKKRPEFNSSSQRIKKKKEKDTIQQTCAQNHQNLIKSVLIQLQHPQMEIRCVLSETSV